MNLLKKRSILMNHLIDGRRKRQRLHQMKLVALFAAEIAEQAQPMQILADGLTIRIPADKRQPARNEAAGADFVVEPLK